MFKAIYDDNIKVYLVVGRGITVLLIDAWDTKVDTHKSDPVFLEGGNFYPIRVEYREITGYANVGFWVEKVE